MRPPARLAVAGITALAAAVAGVPATAGAFRVTPVSVELAPQRATGVLTLVNTGEEPVTVQLRVFAWDQSEGEDRLTPTRAVVASPPAITLTPGVSQVVRVVHLQPGAADAKSREESYRVLVDEIPDRSRQRPGEVAMVLRQSIPIFFSGGPSEPDISWTLRREGEALHLVGRNSGGRRVRLNDLELKSSDGSVAHRRTGLVGYVLPGAQMRWPIDLKQQNAAEALSLSATTDRGPIRAALPFPSP